MSATRLPVMISVAASLVALAVLVPAVANAATRPVNIQNFAFSPTPITIVVGDSVVWTNRDPATHSAFFSDSFKTQPLAQGQSGSLTFTSAGTFNYVCAFHPGTMSGTVVVQAATPVPTAPPPPPPTPAPTPPRTPLPTPVRTAPPTVAPTLAPTAPPTPEPTPAPTTAAPTATATPAAQTLEVATPSPSAVAAVLTPAPGPSDPRIGPLIVAGALVLVAALGAVAWLVARRS